jgi:hypothetical protein
VKDGRTKRLNGRNKRKKRENKFGIKRRDERKKDQVI